MDAIYNNSNNINLLNNNSNNITLVNDKQITNKNSNNNNTNTLNKTDSIEITEKDENKINKQKASDAFQESLSEFDKDIALKNSVQFVMVKSMMEFKGIDVPTFNINDKENTCNFLPFIDKMKDFVNKENITDKNGTPIDETSFLDFCDVYKEKLVKYDCK